VLSIDVGLRNLGLAVVRLVDGGELATLAREDSVTPLGVVSREVVAAGDTLEEPRDVAQLLSERIYVEHAENVDVLEENGCTAKNAKAIGPLRQVTFWHSCMLRRASLLLEPAPDLVVVEVQDGGNATMRQMSTGIVGLFMGHFEARHRDGHLPRVPAFTMVRGDMKLKICDRIQAVWGARGGAGAETVAPKGHCPSLSELGQSGGRRRPSSASFQGPTAQPAAGAPLESPPAATPVAPPAEPPAYLLKVNPRRYYALQRAREKEIAAQAKMAELGLEAGAGEAGPEAEDEDLALLTPAAKKRVGRSRAAYELRKRLAVASFELYMERVLGSSPHLLNRELRLGWRRYTQKKRRDVSDAVLQGVYVIARELKLV
jgi:hypothetical protein